MGTGMKQKPGTKLWKRWAAVRMGALLLTVCLLAGSIPANGLTAAAAAVLEKEDAAAYEIYLADFLSQEPRLRSDLSLDMLHRRLNTAMDEESGFRESADAYLFLTDGGSLVFNSRQELYKQILLEILCRQAASGDTLEKARESCGTWRDTILEYAAMALDYGPDVLGSEGALRQMLASASVAELQNAFLASTVYGVVQEQGKAGSLEGILQDLGLNGRANREALEACLTKIDDAAYASGRTLRRAVEQTAGEFRLSGGGGSAASGAGSAFSSETASGIGLCVNLLLSTTQNMLEYTEKLAMYMALSEHREGTLEFLELMYRQTDDPSLMAAIRSVSDGIRAVSSGDVAQLAAELRYGTSLKMVSDILLNLVQQWAGAAGLLTGGTAILTDLLFRSGEIAELSRLLDAQIAVEDAVRAGLRYMINAYSGTYQQAVTLNTGAYMLYDTYEYGMELAVAYAEAVMDDAWISRIGNKLLEFFRRGVYGSRYVPREGSYSFKELAKAYEALITTGRSAFDSARLMYEEEHPGPSVSADIWENPPVFVTGIFMEKDPLILPLSGGENQAYFASASAVPANADNRRIRYRAADAGCSRQCVDHRVYRGRAVYRPAAGDCRPGAGDGGSVRQPPAGGRAGGILSGKRGWRDAAQTGGRGSGGRRRSGQLWGKSSAVGGFQLQERASGDFRPLPRFLSGDPGIRQRPSGDGAGFQGKPPGAAGRGVGGTAVLGILRFPAGGLCGPVCACHTGYGEADCRRLL